MQTSIEKLAKNPAGDSYDDTVFKTVLEDHLTWLINHENTVSVPVTAHQVEIYDFDWVGLLTNVGVSTDLHWIVIRMNGGKSLTDVPLELRALRVPSTSVIQNLMMLQTSTKRIK